MDMQILKGREHIKRVIEVAAVQNHGLHITCVGCYDDGANYVYPIAYALGATNVEITTPCPCGNRGDTERNCTCSEVLMERWYSEQGKKIRRATLFVEMPSITSEKLINGRLGEPSSVVRERITRAQILLATIDTTLDAAGLALMRAAVKQLAFSQYQYDQMLEVSRTSAALAGATCIGPAHLAEALQYRSKNMTKLS